jgi:hypothetical protein
MDSESTPAAPRFAWTRLYAFHTAILEMLYGFAWLDDSSRFRG